MTTASPRAHVTVAVLVGDDKRALRVLEEELTGQLVPDDNLVLLGPRHDPGLASSWRTRRGRALLERAAVPCMPHELVLVLDDRVLPAADLVGSLVTAAASSDVDVLAARSNVAAGDELLVGIPYRPGDAGARQAWMRARAESAAHRVTPAAHLEGPCLLVRRRVLDAVGGLAALAEGAGPAELSLAAREAGLGLAVAEGAYVHHPGGPPRRPRSGVRPLVSACLIVKDEEHQLAGCLASAGGVADEVVVYDTGSRDGTVALARRLGAYVVEGDWDGDFARARNAALGSCRGEWILWLDADETLACGDRPALRARLERAPATIEGFLVPIDNLQGTETSTMLTHPAVRIFRRASCRWDGRVHEQVVRRSGPPEPALVPVEDARITHRGYLQASLRNRDKGMRNLRSAFADLAGGSELDLATRVLSLGRSYMLAGRYEEGAELCQRCLELAPRPPTRRLALRSLADAHLALGRPQDALTCAADLRASGTVTPLADIVEGRARVALGELEAALAAFERVGEVVDDDGFQYRPSLVADGRATVLARLGRHGEAADVLLTTLQETGGIDSHLGLLVEALEAAGRDPGEIHAVLPSDRVVAFVPQLLQLEAGASDRVLEAWHRRDPASLPVLATATRLGPRLPVARRLVWSARVRRAGLSAPCPLVHSSASPLLAARDRSLSAAVAWASFADPRARQAFVAGTLEVGAAERSELRAEVAAVAPTLLGTFDALTPLAARTRPRAARAQGTTVRHVLVLSRVAGALRSLATAATLAHLGHDVVLCHPGTSHPPASLLAAPQITVRTWDEPDATRWHDACLAVVARLYAERPIDAVVLGPGAEPLAGRLGGLVPTARALHDGPAGAPFPPALLPPTTLSLEGDRLVPIAARSGVCLVAHLRDDEATAALVADGILPALTTPLPGVPVAHWGDDPANVVSRVAPPVLALGTAADPAFWMAGARAVVVAGNVDLGEAARLAEALGTPVVHAAPTSLADTLERVGTLLADDGAWHDAHAACRARVAATAPAPSPDPCAALAPPTRRRAGSRRRDRGRPRPLVRVASPVGRLDSLAQVNRELARHLARVPRSFDLVVATPEDLPLPGEAAAALAAVPIHALSRAPQPDVEIRHQWPPDFRPLRSGAPLVCIQPFEFGGLPAEWIGPLRDVVDELWVPTTWVRGCAIDSGVPPEKVHVVPNGVDAGRFRSDGPRYPLRTSRRTKLLFVGGCIERKGIDALLEAYLSTFSDADDVCLVVKPYGSDGAYRASSLEADVRRAAAGGGAEIELVDDDLGLDEMPSLYRACDALVHPFRGEGFGLPIAEAMACGLPVVVTEGGAPADFCDDEVAWLVPARKVALRPSEWTPSRAGAWWLEPSRSALGAALRGVVERPELARRRGAAGARRIAERFTWQQAADRAAARIEALLASDGALSLGVDRLATSQRERRRSS